MFCFRRPVFINCLKLNLVWSWTQAVRNSVLTKNAQNDCYLVLWPLPQPALHPPHADHWPHTFSNQINTVDRLMNVICGIKRAYQYQYPCVECKKSIEYISVF
jgi:hypothetical protein